MVRLQLGLNQTNPQFHITELFYTF